MALTVDPVAVELNGEQFQVFPFNWVQLKKVARTLALLRASLPTVTGFDEEGAVQVDFLTLYALHADEVSDLMALAIDKPVDWLAVLSPSEGMDLLAAVLQANKDEFQKKVLPAVQKLLEMLKP